MSTKFLTITNLQQLFAVSQVTIYHWRQGSEARDPLPVATDKANPRALVFLPSAVKAWAKKYKVEMTGEPASLLGTAYAKPAPAKKAPAKSVPAKKATEAKPAAKKPALKAVPTAKVDRKKIEASKPTEAPESLAA